jgi:nucleoside-diphosphate-sugar epimerase
MKKKLFITGGSGFVGRQLLATLVARAVFDITALVRKPPAELIRAVDYLVLPDFAGIDGGYEGLQDADVVIHLASRVHVMNDVETDPLAAYRETNVVHTLNLARSAAQAGVKRFVFISSVKVNGEGTAPGNAYRESDAVRPLDPYGISKMEAEEGLKIIAAETGLEVVIIRPVLVYGPGVRANFESMMKWLHRGVPLPFGSLDNKRSLVGVGNLVDFISVCIDHLAAANQTFLISDGHDVSTSELLRSLGAALGHPARLIPVPSWMLVQGATLLGKKALSQRLCGSLQVDIDKARSLLNWRPILTLEQGLKLTADHFLNELQR